MMPNAPYHNLPPPPPRPPPPFFSDEFSPLSWGWIRPLKYVSSLAGYGLQRRNNFENALNGCLTLLRVLTGENWETVMRDCSIQPPFCTPTEGPYGSQAEMERRGWDRGEFIGDCGNPTLAILFFDVFYLIGNNVLLNLFIAVLLDNFFTLQSNFVLSEQHLESYQKVKAGLWKLSVLTNDTFEILSSESSVLYRDFGFEHQALSTKFLNQVWRDIDPLSKGVISIWRFRELVERLHADNNPLGSCVLSNEIKFRYPPPRTFRDNQSIHTLHALNIPPDFNMEKCSEIRKKSEIRNP
jgi:hypothetical protein